MQGIPKTPPPTHPTNPCHACGLLNYLQDHCNVRITFTTILVVILFLCPPRLLFFFFPRVTLSEEEGTTPFPPASPQIKQFHNRP